MIEIADLASLRHPFLYKYKILWRHTCGLFWFEYRTELSRNLVCFDLFTNYIVQQNIRMHHWGTTFDINTTFYEDTRVGYFGLNTEQNWTEIWYCFDFSINSIVLQNIHYNYIHKPLFVLFLLWFNRRMFEPNVKTLILNAFMTSRRCLESKIITFSWLIKVVRFVSIFIEIPIYTFINQPERIYMS